MSVTPSPVTQHLQGRLQPPAPPGSGLRSEAVTVFISGIADLEV